MINLISAILFSFSANLDNIAIGISYGLKKIHISNYKILMISIFTTLFTFISMYLGDYFSKILNKNIANSLGAYLLIILGIYTLVKDMLNKNNPITLKDISKCKIVKICFKDFMTIILMLSTNNIAAGIAASVTGVNILLTIISSFFFSYIFLYIGNKIGKYTINNFIQKNCNLISSLILIIIGIIQL